MTIRMDPIVNFGDLSLQEAENILYTWLIPLCESKGVMLSEYGNHNAIGSLCSLEQYEKSKASRSLFDTVEKIQIIVSSNLDHIFKSLSTYRASSYGLKHAVEKRLETLPHPYITNGELIAAMILKGYNARFAKQGEPLGVNCEFKVKVI